MESLNQCTLTDIPWEDVLFKKVLQELSLKDLFNLRATSRTNKLLVEAYLRIIKYINLAIYSKFNSRSFKVLAVHCHNVQRANLYKCNWLKERDLTLFFKNNPNIADVNFNYCNTHINQYLQTLVVNCKKLRKIYLSGCRHLSVGAVESLIYHQQNLKTLDLSRCDLLTEKCITKLIIKFHNIKNLLLVGIPSVNDRIILTISQHCKSIENLNVDGCSVNILLISKIKQFCPKIKSVRACNTYITYELLKEQ